MIGSTDIQPILAYLYMYQGDCLFKMNSLVILPVSVNTKKDNKGNKSTLFLKNLPTFLKFPYYFYSKCLGAYEG